MRTITIDEAKERCEASEENLVGKIMIGGCFAPIIGIGDTLELAVEDAQKTGAEITVEDVDATSGRMDSDGLYAWRVED